MRKIERLNTLARRMADALIARYPAFNRRLIVLDEGDLRSEIRAPHGSNAYGLCVSTMHGSETYVQFGVANAFYPIDSAGELIRIVTGIVADRICFVVVSKQGKWVRTTLTRSPDSIRLKKSEVASIISWTGLRDQTKSH